MLFISELPIFWAKLKIFSSDSQVDFRGKHSTSRVILQLVDEIVTGREKSFHTLGVFLDLPRHLTLSTIPFFV